MEKEIGTMEQINVSPVPRAKFIVAKLIPFWLVGLVILTEGILIARFIYGIIPVGHYYTLYFFAVIYIFTVSGLGLIISNIAQTLQQAMFIVFFLVKQEIGGKYFALAKGTVKQVFVSLTALNAKLEISPSTHTTAKVSSKTIFASRLSSDTL